MMGDTALGGLTGLVVMDLDAGLATTLLVIAAFTAGLATGLATGLGPITFATGCLLLFAATLAAGFTSFTDEFILAIQSI
jgi:hypothetical protein